MPPIFDSFDRNFTIDWLVLPTTSTRTELAMTFRCYCGRTWPTVGMVLPATSARLRYPLPVDRYQALRVRVTNIQKSRFDRAEWALPTTHQNLFNSYVCRTINIHGNEKNRRVMICNFEKLRVRTGVRVGEMKNYVHRTPGAGGWWGFR